jgi:uncharacterized protein (DUF736 family)|tara:strand:- start:1628 stop:1963 length:336 start_codon:yes stop_codon:yes gene_type:complete
MAANNPFKTDGGLWINPRKTQSNNHPDFKGHIKVTKEQMQLLVQRGAAGMEVQLELGAWKVVSKNGKAYISLSADVYLPKERAAPPPEPELDGHPVAPPNPFGDFGDEGTF